MAHNRKNIRDAVVAVLTGLPTTRANVFGSRVYPLEASNLPALLVFLRQESVDYESVSLRREQRRTLSLDVLARVKSSVSVDDLLDQISTEVEAAMDASSMLSGLVSNLTLNETRIEVDGDGDQPHGTATLSYELAYYTTEDI